jgi:hypothetical protein
MWDNRFTKKNPKAPDFKCKDKGCDGVIWPPKEGEFQQVKKIMEQPVAITHAVTRPTLLDERQRAIIRQHSQSMALEVLKLKVTLSELTIDDLTPAKLRSLADYFDADVLKTNQGEEEF